jgi:hypothetical protein
MGTTCTVAGESQCNTSGDRCVCQLGMWYCNTACASTYPTQPTPNTTCLRGAACTYGDAGCACVNSLWMCVGGSSCPDAASLPVTGQDCSAQTGITCDYPNTNPAPHMVCVCSANADAGSGSTWTCIQSAVCPATPPYDLTEICRGTAVCTYDAVHCACLQAGTPWLCV